MSAATPEVLKAEQNQLETWLRYVKKDEESCAAALKAKKAELDEYTRLSERINEISKHLVQKINIPIGRMAFISGELTRTNEYYALVGDNTLIKRSAFRTKELIERRTELITKSLQQLDEELKMVVERRRLAEQLFDNAFQSDEVEIREPYDETASSANKAINHQSVTKKDFEELMAHLDELEMLEEEEEEEIRQEEENMLERVDEEDEVEKYTEEELDNVVTAQRQKLEADEDAGDMSDGTVEIAESEDSHQDVGSDVVEVVEVDDVDAKAVLEMEEVVDSTGDHVKPVEAKVNKMENVDSTSKPAEDKPSPQTPPNTSDDQPRPKSPLKSLNHSPKFSVTPAVVQYVIQTSDEDSTTPKANSPEPSSSNPQPRLSTAERKNVRFNEEPDFRTIHDDSDEAAEPDPEAPPPKYPPPDAQPAASILRPTTMKPRVDWGAVKEMDRRFAPKKSKILPASTSAFTGEFVEKDPLNVLGAPNPPPLRRK